MRLLSYKGEASYYRIPAGSDHSLNAVWTYETPFEAMARIKDRAADPILHSLLLMLDRRQVPLVGP
jgi:hypothetical protein